MRAARGGYWGRFARLLAAAGAAASLAACVEAATDTAPNLAEHRPMERRENVSLAPATVAFVSMEGAPDSLAKSFMTDLGREASAHDIVIVDAKKARYLVRGYLSAAPTADGARLEYVWDVFGPDKQREFRLNDVMGLKGQADDAWSLVSDAALNSVAAKSADDLAAFLSYTPEAKPIAQADGVPASALGYAPLN